MVQFASYLRRVLCTTRLIFPRINGLIVTIHYLIGLIVILSPHQKSMPFILWIKIINTTSNKSNIKNEALSYLGIMIDWALSWKHKSLCHKISKSKGIIAKMRHYLPRHLLLDLSYALSSFFIPRFLEIFKPRRSSNLTLFFFLF